MAIWIDPPSWPAHGRLWSHVISDTSYDELHAFALRAGCDQCGVRLLGNIEVIAVKPPRRHTGPQSKGVQLVIGGVTDHMRPQTAVRRPAWWVDPDRHRLLLISGADPNRPTAVIRS